MRTMLSAKAAKAWVGGTIAAAAFLGPVVDDGLAVSEGLGVLGAFLVAFQAVYWTTNQDT